MIIALCVLFGLIVCYFILGFVLLHILLHRRTKDSWDTVPEKGKRALHQSTAIEAFSKLQITDGFNIMSVKTTDGLTLKGYEIVRGDNWAVCVHGYHVDGRLMSAFAQAYLEAGYSILMPNLRGHGISEGNYATMSYKDGEDLLLYLKYITDNHPNAKILLHGASMGGATVLTAAGHNPKGVRAVISDCAFSDAPGVFFYHMKHMKFVTKFPAYYAFSAANVLAQKFNLKNAAPVKWVSKTNIPVLFIHGDADRYVPYPMMDTLYTACNSPKHQYTCKGAEHFLSHITAPDEYREQVLNFLNKYYYI